MGSIALATSPIGRSAAAAAARFGYMRVLAAGPSPSAATLHAWLEPQEPSGVGARSAGGSSRDAEAMLGAEARGDAMGPE